MSGSTSPSTDEAIHWGDNFLLGFGPMDAVHQEFVGLLRNLQTADDAGLYAALQALAVQTRNHFSLEDSYMQGSEFPARECHVDEHAAVLKSIDEVLALTAQGDFAVCRRLAQSLAEWFPAHADYLDSALAHWMCKQQTGGKPVVLRRNLQHPQEAT